MGKPKKNQLHQVIFPMVDATDFATIESAITSVVGRYYGVNYAGSAATTSGAVSKTASVVHSGIFRMTLKAAENNYDNMLVRITSTGCADQILTWENADYDDSDLHSLVTAVQSDFQSRVPKAVATNSQLVAVQSDIKSQATVAYAMLSDLQSDFQSRVPKAVATNSQVSDLASDLKSYLTAMSSMDSNIHSTVTGMSDILSKVYTQTTGASDIGSKVYAMLSDFKSDFQSRVPKAVATNSQLSDLASDLKSYLTGMSGLISDIDSQLNVSASGIDDCKGRTSTLLVRVPSTVPTVSGISDMMSNMLSAMVPNVSDAISDIYVRQASQFTIVNSALSNLQSRVPKAVATNSQLTAVQSDIKSQATVTYALLSDIQSDFQSRVPKAVATNSQLTAVQSDLRSQATAIQSDVKSGLGAITVTIGPSDISDIVSGVIAAGGGATQSQVQVIVTAATSDIKSQATATYATLSDFYSDFQSRVPKLAATSSQLTAVQSDIKSQATTLYNLMSDIQSDFQSRVPKAVATNSQLTAVQSDIRSQATAISASDISDIRSAITAASSDIKSQITATQATLSDVQSMVVALDTLLDKFAPIIIGTVSGAGTASEVFVYGGVTATVVADSSGNRTSVTFS